MELKIEDNDEEDSESFGEGVFQYFEWIDDNYGYVEGGDSFPNQDMLMLAKVCLLVFC